MSIQSLSSGILCDSKERDVYARIRCGHMPGRCDAGISFETREEFCLCCHL